MWEGVTVVRWEGRGEGGIKDSGLVQCTTVLVLSPDLIQRVYRFQYNARGLVWVWDQDYNCP